MVKGVKGVKKVAEKCPHCGGCMNHEKENQKYVDRVQITYNDPKTCHMELTPEGIRMAEWCLALMPPRLSSPNTQHLFQALEYLVT